MLFLKRKDNRPFPSSKKSHFESEAKCEAIDVKMIFNYDANKTHFHNKGFALSLVLKVRFFGTRKWPISLFSKVKLLSILFNLFVCGRAREREHKPNSHFCLNYQKLIWRMLTPKDTLKY